MNFEKIFFIIGTLLPIFKFNLRLLKTPSFSLFPPVLCTHQRDGAGHLLIIPFFILFMVSSSIIHLG